MGGMDDWLDRHAHIIFVSYSHDDNITWVAAHLQSLLVGVSPLRQVWTDREIPPGADWQETIDDAIRRCEVFLLFVPPSYSPDVHRECRLAIKKGKQIIPVFLGDEDRLPVLEELGLSHLQAARIRMQQDSPNWADVQALFESL